MVLFLDIQQSVLMNSGNDQNVRRGLRIDIIDREQRVRFINLIRRNTALADFTEQAIIHTIFSPVPSGFSYPCLVQFPGVAGGQTG